MFSGGFVIMFRWMVKLLKQVFIKDACNIAHTQYMPTSGFGLLWFLAYVFYPYAYPCANEASLENTVIKPM